MGGFFEKGEVTEGEDAEKAITTRVCPPKNGDWNCNTANRSTNGDRKRMRDDHDEMSGLDRRLPSRKS